MMTNMIAPLKFSYAGSYRQNQLDARQNGGIHFAMLNGRAKWYDFWKKLFGRDNGLRNLRQIAAVARRQPARQAGVVTVLLEKIVGSEGRADDFDSRFRPLRDEMLERWVSIYTANRTGVSLPPVVLIQVNDEYYVHDGHHRISVAKAVGQKAMEAKVLYKLEVSQ